MEQEVLFPTGAAAKRLGVSRERVVQLVKAGAVQHIRDATGRRLIPAGEVERLRRERKRVFPLRFGRRAPSRGAPTEGPASERTRPRRGEPVAPVGPEAE